MFKLLPPKNPQCAHLSPLQSRNAFILVSSYFIQVGSGRVKFCHPRFSAKPPGLHQSIQLGDNFLSCLIIAAKYAGPGLMISLYYRVVINIYFCALEFFCFVRFFHSYMYSNNTFDFELPERSGGWSCVWQYSNGSVASIARRSIHTSHILPRKQRKRKEYIVG
jgi:hypothetical protein